MAIWSRAVLQLFYFAFATTQETADRLASEVQLQPSNRPDLSGDVPVLQGLEQTLMHDLQQRCQKRFGLYCSIIRASKLDEIALLSPLF